MPLLASIQATNITEPTNIFVQDINLTSHNITDTNYGFFSFLGSIGEKISKIFAKDIQTINLEVTNDTTVHNLIITGTIDLTNATYNENIIPDASRLQQELIAFLLNMNDGDV